MKSKIITVIGATSLVFGMFALQGCYETNYPDYGGYGYGSGYGYGRGYYSAPVIVEEHSSWHDRWWGHQDRDSDRHEGWRTEHSERQAHADRDRDHDRD